jgi:hypothetical protein
VAKNKVASPMDVPGSCAHFGTACIRVVPGQVDKAVGAVVRPLIPLPTYDGLPGHLKVG